MFTSSLPTYIIYWWMSVSVCINKKCKSICKQVIFVSNNDVIICDNSNSFLCDSKASEKKEREKERENKIKKN